MKNWLRSLLGLDKIQESNLLNLENNKLLVKQNMALIAEINLLKISPPKAEVRYIRFPNEENLDHKNVVSLPVIKEFSLTGNKNKHSLDFSLITTDMISSDWCEISQSNTNQHQLKAMMSSLTSSGVALQGAATQSTKGLFQATVSPDKLMTYNNGTVSSIVKDASGKIQEHSGFTQAGNAAFNPLLVMQFASILTGQYYFKGITNQLNKVLDKLDNLQRMHHIEREAKMKYSFNQLQSYSYKTAFTLEDFVNLKQISYDLQVIRNEYLITSKETIDKIQNFINPLNLEKQSMDLEIDEANQIEKTLASVKDGVMGAMNKVSTSKVGLGMKSFSNSVGKTFSNSKGKVAKINEKISELAPYYTFKSAITAEELYQISRLVELKMNLAVKDMDSDRIAKIYELKEELHAFRKEDLLHFSMSGMVENFNKVTQARFLELKSESAIEKNAIQILIQNSTEDFQTLKEINNKSIETIRSLNLEAANSFAKESEVLLDNRGNQPKFFVKAEETLIS